MRAMVVPRFGGPDVLEPAEVPTPVPGPGQISIDVEHAAVNFTDVRNRRGDGLGVPPFIPGIEVSGRVRRLGAGVSGPPVGRRVAAATLGHGYAEVAVADARRVFPLPDHLAGRPVAAALPGVVPNSLRLLRRAARLLPGETMLVHGASGGVATALVQTARVLGLGPVSGTVSTPFKAEYASRFGYQHVFLRDTFREDLLEATGGRGVDVVFDPIGGETRRRSFDVLAPFGRLVHFGNASLEPEEPPDALTMRARALGYIGYSSAQHLQRDPEGTRADYEEGIRLVSEGEVTIDITRVYPLEQAADAHRDVERGTALGKLVLEVSAS